MSDTNSQLSDSTHLWQHSRDEDHNDLSKHMKIENEADMIISPLQLDAGQYHEPKPSNDSINMIQEYYNSQPKADKTPLMAATKKLTTIMYTVMTANRDFVAQQQALKLYFDHEESQFQTVLLSDMLEIPAIYTWFHTQTQEVQKSWKYWRQALHKSMRKEVERIMRNIVRNQAKQPQNNLEPKVTTFILKH